MNDSFYGLFDLSGCLFTVNVEVITSHFQVVLLGQLWLSSVILVTLSSAMVCLVIVV
jgi:hypothetical protein